MKTDWEVKTLGQIADIKGGKRVPKGYRLEVESTKYPYIRVTDFNDAGSVNLTDIHYINDEVFQQIKNYTISSNDLYISIAGTIGKTGIIPKELEGANLTENACKLVFRGDIEPKFIYYFTQTESFLKQAGLHTRTAAMPKLALTRLSTISLLIPNDRSEQQRIVAILDEAFAAIDKAKENAQKNLQNARALFDSYLQSVFANPGEDWEEKSLAEVCEISSKLIDPRNADFINMLHVGGANIESVTGELFDLKTAKEEGLISGKFLFNESMVLYSKIRPYLMKVARPDFKGLCSADIYPLLPVQGKMTRDYLFHLLLSPNFTQYAIKGSARAGMPKVNREHLFEYRFYIGPIEEQIQIVSKLDALSIETKKLEAIYQQKLTNLDELKKAILQKAFRGELTATPADALTA